MTVARVDQGMAAAAASVIPPDVDRELRTRYRQLRVMLHSAGLAATYAYIASKAGDRGPLERAYRDAALGIRRRLAEAGLLNGEPRALTVREMMTQLGAMDPVQYARASTEAAAFAGWLSRLADAVWQERSDRA